MLPLLAGALAGLKFGTTGAVIAGGLTGLLTNKEDPLGGAAMGALGGYSGGELLQGLSAAGAGAGAASGVPESVGLSTLPAQEISNTFGGNYLNGDVANSMVNTPIGQGGLQFGMSGVAPSGAVEAVAPELGFADKLAAAGRGIANLPTAEGWNAFKAGMGEPGKPATGGQPAIPAKSATGGQPAIPAKSATDFQAATAIGLPLFNVAGSLGAFDPEYASPEEEEDKYKKDGGLYLYGPKSSPALSLYAAGGTVQQGGLMDLYGVNDSQYGPAISQQGYGLGRLNTLAAQQSQAKAEMGQYAKGGGLEEGGFVIPADVVSGLGNGSTDAGLAVLAKKYGAKPIKGKGDGMSDSIPTTIEGKEKARVADGEAYIPKAIVKKMGGPEKLYAMMDRVRKARTGTTKQGKEINPNRYA